MEFEERRTWFALISSDCLFVCTNVAAAQRSKRKAESLCKFKIKLAIWRWLPNEEYRRPSWYRTFPSLPIPSTVYRPCIFRLGSLIAAYSACTGSPRPLNFPARHSTIIFAPRHVPPHHLPALVSLAHTVSLKSARVFCLYACIPHARTTWKANRRCTRWNANRLPSLGNYRASNRGQSISSRDLGTARFLLACFYSQSVSRFGGAATGVAWNGC